MNVCFIFFYFAFLIFSSYAQLCCVVVSLVVSHWKFNTSLNVIITARNTCYGPYSYFDEYLFLHFTSGSFNLQDDHSFSSLCKNHEIKLLFSALDFITPWHVHSVRHLNMTPLEMTPPVDFSRFNNFWIKTVHIGPHKIQHHYKIVPSSLSVDTLFTVDLTEWQPLQLIFIFNNFTVLKCMFNV